MSSNVPTSTPAAPAGDLPPGVGERSAELSLQLDEAVRHQGPPAHLHHAQGEGWPKFTNRLVLESSPYLQQHAHNPVDWCPWGDEAFDLARREGRPVLLSIGYSTCHWCHVMERESFEDLEIAEVLNSLYVPIKVDREERPDVDGIYMAAVQLIQGRGGWPMTLWLTPDRRPFHAATYVPARDGDRGAGIGFLTMLHRLRQAYDEQPDRIVASASGITDAIRRALEPVVQPGKLPGAKVLRRAAATYAANFDSLYGGLQGAPKFPSSLPVRFLLRYHRRSGDEQALLMATTSLERMAAGGMYDQVGGGFHRYSVDREWLVPHFEKMIYDNALLTMDYLEAYQLTGREDFARIGREILDYVGREMTSPEGLFFSATDADSEGDEGVFFVWSIAELERVLGDDLARAAVAFWGASERGNFEGGNILHRPRPAADVALELGLSVEALAEQIETARKKLYAEREKRVHPSLDHKILTAWNGLMISAHARAARMLSEPRYGEAASRAMGALLDRLRVDGLLRRSWAEGAARHDAVLDDYAFLIAACIDLFEFSWNHQWLSEALSLQALQDQLFLDLEQGAYRFTASTAEQLLARERPAYDGALPSGNSVTALNLYRLASLTGEDQWRAKGDALLQLFASQLEESPTALAQMLLAVDFRNDASQEAVILAPPGTDAGPLLAQMARTFAPNTVIVGAGPGTESLALLAGREALGGRATAFVCRGGLCNLPTNDPEELARQLREFKPLGE